MGIINKIEKLEHLDQLIRLKRTGPPRELAERLQISESSLYDLLTLAKILGAQINYNYSKCTYEYMKPMRFVFGFVEKLELKNKN